MSTTLSQLCTITTNTDGQQVFRIVSTMGTLNTGDLPSLDVFVFSLPVPSDPKADVFLRVASVIDLTALPKGRDAALAAGASFYVWNTVTLDYPVIDAAVQAKAVIAARVDDLIAAWIHYTTEFITATLDLPLVSPSVITAAKNAYYAAAAAHTTAVATQATAATASTAAGAAATRANNALVHATQAAIFLLACDAEVLLHAGDADFIAALAAFRVVEPTTGTAAAAKATADTTYSTSLTTLHNANVALTNATSALAAALAAVLIVCPSFTP